MIGRGVVEWCDGAPPVRNTLIITLYLLFFFFKKKKNRSNWFAADFGGFATMKGRRNAIFLLIFLHIFSNSSYILI